MFEPYGAIPGNYTLMIESYDSNDIGQPTVKEPQTLYNDTITIIVKYGFVRDLPLPATYDIIARSPNPLNVPSIRSDP